MTKLPRDIGTLFGILAFCAVALVGLLRATPPLAVLKKAAICGLALALVARVGAYLAFGVIRAGLRQNSTENRV